MKTENKCKCTLKQWGTGDGCRYCNPQFYIDKLEERIAEMECELSEIEWRHNERDSWGSSG